MRTPADLPAAADDVRERIGALPTPTVDAVRRVRREFSREIKDWAGDDVLALAFALVERQSWVAYELVYHHAAALSALTRPTPYAAIAATSPMSGGTD